MKIAVLGNAIVDGFANVTDAVLSAHKLEKRGFNKLDPKAFFALCADVEVETYASGGSAANVAYTLGKLGAETRFLGRFGSDSAGQIFFDDMVAAGVGTCPPDASAKTMEVFVLVTPDGARTLATLGTTARMSDVWVSENAVKNADWLLVEGYLLADQAPAVDFALKLARENGTKIMFTLAGENILRTAEEALLQTLIATNEDGQKEAGVHLILGDTAETAGLMAILNQNPSSQKIVQTIPRITTHSGDGATFYNQENTPTFAPTQKIDNPVDVTGAGDAFAAGFLHAYMAGQTPAQALNAGHGLAQQVIMHLGGRIKEIKD